ncbi:MAG: tetratricopeptide repeat protein [Gemmatimonadetes bacterium]|nr:tetratricopeptide repeat protein [Gemmatimonadota bacterium]NNL30117.1 tetratricopeptide repeat protein [Gemmatimonadota bacterium]
MKGYTTREVAEVLGLPTSRILSWTRRGLISPSRGAHGYVFSFQDIVLLRTARELLDADIPAKRVSQALEALRGQLPAGRPLSAVTISALGDRVLVRDEDTVWEPDTGQLRMDFPVSDVAEAARPVVRRALHEQGRDEGMTADDWYDSGVDLEAVSLEDAIVAYRHALELDATHSDAHLNLGRLLHESGRVKEAEEHYRRAATADPESARAFYNLGVALDDQSASAGAIEAYEAALRLDPELAVAHFNLSRLYEAGGRAADALAHLAHYKKILDRGGIGA